MTLVSCKDDKTPASTKIEFEVSFKVGNKTHATIDYTYDTDTKKTTYSGTGLPLDPVVAEYTFDGWYFDRDTWEKPFEFDKVYDHYKNGLCPVYARLKYDPNYVPNKYYTLSFVTGCDITYETMDCETSKDVVLPMPIREGFIFAGWYFDESFTRVYRKASLVANNYSIDFTLYAKWVPGDNSKISTVNFDSCGGSDVAAIADIKAGSYIKAPTAPTKSEVFFGGWFTDVKYEHAFDFETMLISEDTTLYARWLNSDKVVSNEYLRR